MRRDLAVVSRWMEGLFQPGAVLLDKYRVEGVVGRGGMGIVLRVTHVHLGEQLALKILLPEAAQNPEVSSRFVREAQAVVRLRGEHVTRVSDVGVLANGAPFIAMEYLHGADLAGELTRRRVLPAGEAVDYVLQACEALAEAHVHGIVHRDIKAANLFVTTRPDGTPMLKVLDFGISKSPVTMGPSTVTNTVMGTPGYMSPEQMRAAKDVDGRTDIWALGIVLYECLNGRRPFDAESFSAAVLKAGTEPPPPMDPRVPKSLQNVVLKCLEKDRAGRYATIGALAAALAPFARDQRSAGIIVDRTQAMQRRASGESEPPKVPLQSAAVTTLTGSAGQSGTMPRRRRAAGAAIVGVGVVGLLVVVVLAATHGSGGDAGGDKAGNALVGSSAGDSGLGSGEASGAASRGATTSDTEIVDAAVVAIPRVPVAVDAAVASSAVDPAAIADITGQCASLQAAHKWQMLDACAVRLDTLGEVGKAKDYRALAIREQQNELAANDFQQLLREKNLKDAEAKLAEVGSDSVYFAPLRDSFTKAENAAIDQATRKANAFTAAHDCASFRTEYKQLQQSSTPRVAAAVASIKCTDKTISDVLIASTPPGCDDANVDDLVTKAAGEYTKGARKTALVLMNQALACRQSDKMYRLGAMYACAAHDLATAKSYYVKVAAANQGGIVQRCLQEGLDVR